jgi:quinol monooxygenase YgiN
MQTFGLNYEVKPECVEDFKSTLNELMESMKASAGHVETRLFADVNQPNMMMIYSDWKTKAEFAQYVRSSNFQEALADTVEMLESTPKHLAGQDIRLIKTPDQDAG